MAEKKKPVSEWLPQVVAWVRSLITQSDHAQNNSAAPDYIKNRTHYVISTTYTDKWNQSNVEVGSGSSSPGAYSGTFTVTTGNKYRVIISNGNNSKTYTDIEAEYNSSLNGMLLNKNWSNPMSSPSAQSDAFYILVQSSNIVLASVDVYGNSCTVQVSEITENVKKLDRKYLPALNEIDHISSSKSGSVTTVTITETEGATTSFQISDGADGTDGTDGTDGKSAYQVAVDNGFVGTEAQWLASLKGDSGVDLGEVAVTSTLTNDTDKVPSDAAVLNGIEVWRDNISYIYSANDLNFDGTNYVNTEWNPYSTDSDFEIRMQISDLLLGSMSNSDTIISCIKQVSPYPGFSIRRNSSTKLEVYINGSARMATVANKDVGSVNTIIFKRVGNVYTFTVNATSTSYTYPSNGVNNSEAITLYIGGYPDANNTPYRFGKFYLDTLTIRNLEHDVQLYANYQKNCKIYPNVSVNSFVNMEHCNGIQLGGSYFKLTQEQLDLINSYDECTIRCIMRADDDSNGSQDWRYFSIGSGSSSTFHISTTYSGIPIVCGKQISDIGAQTICHPLVWSIVLNKKLGTVKYYRNQDLYLEDNSDNFKITNFFTNYLYTSGGDNGCKYYDVAIYNTNYANHLRTSAGQSFETAIDNTGILPVFKNFPKAQEGWTNLSTYKPYGSYTSQTVSGTDVINYHTAASSAGTMGGTNSNGVGFTTSGYAAVVEIPFTTDKQIWIQQYRGQLQYINVLYNEQGEVIPFDETHTQAPAKKIPAGNYTLVVYNYSAPNLYIGEYWTAEAEATITIHQRRYRWVCAVIHLCCNCIYEGNKIYDDVSKQFYLKYTSNSLTTSGLLYSQNTPSKYILTVNKSVPHFVGEIKTSGDNIYQANKNYVWKQINNS